MQNHPFRRRLTCGVALALAATFAAGTAHAEEGVTPLQPGITTGIPVAALPPPGLYLSLDFANITAGHLDIGGNNLPIKLNFPMMIPLLTWVPGNKVLGANYAAGISQPYGWIKVNATGVGGPRTTGTGPFNTVVMPYILSWNVGHGWFVGTSMTVYVPDGNHRVDYVDGVPVRDQRSWANNYWTIEPSLSFSYLGDGWNFTFNNVVDLNMKNHQTGYHSGNVYYLELTGTRTIGKWSVGLVGNYTQQLNDDELRGEKVGNGMKAEHVLLGPYIAYNFGRYSVAFKYLANLHTRNDLDISLAHLVFSMKL